jgi:signal transduction histidine kinase
MAGLRGRLFTIVLLSLLPALALLVYTSYQHRRLQEQRIQEEAHRLLDLTLARYREAFDDAERVLEVLSHMPTARTAAGSECSEVLANVQRGHAAFANVAVIGTDGVIRCSAVPLAGPVDVSDRLYYLKALETRAFSVGRFQFGRITKRYSINVAVPVDRTPGRPTEVVFVAIDLEALNRSSAGISLPEGADFAIVDGDATVVARQPDPERWVGRRLPMAEVVRLMEGRERGVAEARGLDGVSRLYAFSTLDGSPDVHVLLGLSKAQVLAASRRVFRGSLAGLAVFGVLLLAAGWLAGEMSIARPFHALLRATQRMTQGDLTARAAVAGAWGELGRLARAFDVMADAIQRREQERDASGRALRRHDRRLRNLHAVELAILTAQSPGDVGRAALGGIRDLVACRRASVMVFDHDGRHATVIAADVSGETSVGDGFRVAVSDLGDLSAARRGELTEITDAAVVEDGPVLRRLREEGIRSLLRVPLVSENRLVGLLHVSRESAGPFDADDRETVREVANRLAVAIRQADLRERLRRHADELESRVQARTAELRRMNAELDAFSYTVSNDLRAPLRAMQGFSEAVLEDYASRLDDTGRDYLRRIAAAAKRMDLLIHGLLTFIELGRADFALGPVDLDLCLREAADRLQAWWGGTPVNLSLRHPFPAVVGHRQALAHAVENILSNAVKFVPPGTAPNIVVTSETSGGRVRLTVQDNGIGIPAEYAERIFKPLERLPGMDDYEGTGIGLAVVRRAVEKMGGSVGLESEPDRGSRFWIELAAAESREDGHGD